MEEEQDFIETSDENTDQENQEQDSDSDVQAKLEEKEREIAKLKAIIIRKKENEKKHINNDNPADDDIRQSVAELKKAEEKRQFGYEHNLAPNVVDYLFKIKGNPTAEDLKDPFIVGGIQALTRKERVEENTPGSSRQSTSVNGKDFFSLSEDDKAKNYDKVVANIVKRKK